MYQVTWSKGLLPEKYAFKFSSARNPIASLVFSVALPMCGNIKTFFNAESLGFPPGSFTKQSNPAPLILPEMRALINACSSINLPHAALTIMALLGIN